jgi:hypothetical protein
MSIKPTDNGREIPWIDAWARPVVRLHPSPGKAERSESHLGGPMLWPHDEPWPHCDGADHVGNYDLTDDQVRGLRTPFAGCAQLYQADFPELPFPDGTDLLQVFLCTIEHEDIFGPDARLVWRAASQVTDPLDDQPAPVLVDPRYVFRPCVFNPCRATQYPRTCELPHELLDELEFVNNDGVDPAGNPSWPTFGDASKIGGWTRWFAGGPGDSECPECGTLRVQLLALSEHEVECTECDRPESAHMGWQLLGGGGALNFLACPNDVHHPVQLLLE